MISKVIETILFATHWEHFGDLDLWRSNSIIDTKYYRIIN